jgi:hypothetical protein
MSRRWWSVYSVAYFISVVIIWGGIIHANKIHVNICKDYVKWQNHKDSYVGNSTDVKWVECYFLVKCLKMVDSLIFDTAVVNIYIYCYRIWWLCSNMLS